MAIDVYFDKDIRDRIRSVYASMASQPAGSDPYTVAYRQGFAAALAAVAISFGIDAPVPKQPTFTVIEPIEETTSLAKVEQELDLVSFLWRKSQI